MQYCRNLVSWRWTSLNSILNVNKERYFYAIKYNIYLLADKDKIWLAINTEEYVQSQVTRNVKLSILVSMFDGFSWSYCYLSLNQIHILLKCIVWNQNKELSSTPCEVQTPIIGDLNSSVITKRYLFIPFAHYLLSSMVVVVVAEIEKKTED